MLRVFHVRGVSGVHIFFPRTHNVQRSAFGALGLYWFCCFVVFVAGTKGGM